MTGPRPDPTVFAAQRLVEQQLMGVVMLDRDGMIIGRHGALVDWVETGRRCWDALPCLKGHERELRALADGERQVLGLAGIGDREADGRDLTYAVHGFHVPDPPGAALVFQDAGRIGEPELSTRPQRDDPMLAGRRPTRADDLAEEAKSAFLANISHELRTPLNVIIGNAEILRDWDAAKLPADELRTFAEDILENGTFLLDHINDLLDLAKAEAGGITLVEEEVDIGEVIDDVMAVVGRQADARTLSLRHESAAGLPRLVGDPRRLRQVMHHLLGNAVQFTPDGGAVSVRSFVDTDGAPTIEVSDDGIGIAPDLLDGALRPFGQAAAPVENRAQSGSGVGLPLARTLVELHGGTLTLHSAPGRGTRVTVRFAAERKEGDR